MMRRESIDEEEITIINGYLPNNIASTTLKLTDFNGYTEKKILHLLKIIFTTISLSLYLFKKLNS